MHPAAALPDWVSQAPQLPLAFAQVREDPALDARIADHLPENARVCMIASGGCTAALLVTHPRVALLQCVDANPAQLALTKLKCRLLRQPQSERLRLLGHDTLAAHERSSALAQHFAELDLPADCLGPLALVSQLGPDHVGRYERCFAQIAAKLQREHAAMHALLRLANPHAQSDLVQPGSPLGRLIDATFDDVLALPNLVALFGTEATKNPVEPFSRHFARRLRWVLSTQPALSNPWLWQMLLGKNPPEQRYPWLDLPAQKPRAELRFQQSFMTAALADGSTWDFIHLSNILDWLTPHEATRTLDQAFNALNPGGFVFIRQLNSSLDIRAAGPRFHWSPQADAWHAEDRSFFYRQLHLGQKS